MSTCHLPPTQFLALISKQTILPSSSHPVPCTIIINKSTGKILDVRPNKLILKSQIESELSAPIEWVQIKDGRTLIPGLVDPHVHDNEPGRTAWEGFHSATAAAVSGGTTTYLSMPLNNIPVTTTKEAFEVKVRAARFGLEGALPDGYELDTNKKVLDVLGRAKEVEHVGGSEAKGGVWCDIGFWGGLIPGQENLDNLKVMLEEGVRGFKCFLCYSGLPEFPKVEVEDIRAAMSVLKNTGSRILFHAEIEGCNHDHGTNSAPEHDSTYASFLASRPQSFEIDAIKLIISLMQAERDDPTVHTPTRMHIVHLSASRAIPLIVEARSQGLPITVETTFHYLTISSEDVPETPTPSTQYKCVPPLRDVENQTLLWEALEAGIIDEIVTDHSPCVPELKNGDFFSAWGGLSMLGCGLSVLWTRVQERNLKKAKNLLPGRQIELNDIVQWCSTSPASLVGLGERKGKIEIGMDADFAVFNGDTEWVVAPEHLNFKHKVSPLIGRKLRGVVEQTYVRGNLVYEHGRGCVGEKVGDLI